MKLTHTRYPYQSRNAFWIERCSLIAVSQSLINTGGSSQLPSVGKLASCMRTQWVVRWHSGPWSCWGSLCHSLLGRSGNHQVSTCPHPNLQMSTYVCMCGEEGGEKGRETSQKQKKTHSKLKWVFSCPFEVCFKVIYQGSINCLWRYTVLVRILHFPNQLVMKWGTLTFASTSMCPRVPG